MKKTDCSSTCPFVFTNKEIFLCSVPTPNSFYFGNKINAARISSLLKLNFFQKALNDFKYISEKINRRISTL